MLGGIFVAMFFGIVPIMKKLGKLTKAEKKPLILCTVINSTIAPYLWFRGLHATSAINAELFSRAEMLFMILLSILFIHETFNKRHAISLGIILFGLLCVALQGFTNGIALQFGDFLIISSALAYAIGGMIVKKYLHGIQPEIIILCRAMVAATAFVFLLPITGVEMTGELSIINPQILLALLGYGFISKFLGVYGFYQAIDNLSVRTVSMAGTLTVVGGMIFANLYLHEPIHWYQVVGGAFIVIGVLSANRKGMHKNMAAEEHHIRQHHRFHV